MLEMTHFEVCAGFLALAIALVSWWVCAAMACAKCAQAFGGESF